jgi:hypothetical protein
MDYLRSKYHVSKFGLTHDLFTVNRRKVIEFCEYVRPRQHSWSCSARMDCVNEELLKIMAGAGCHSIYYGVETGSPRLQRVIEKNLDLSLVHRILDSTVDLGMAATVSLITGYPQEGVEDQGETLDLIGDCLSRYGESDHVDVQLHLLTPEPGTRLLQDFGERLAYDGHISDFNFPTVQSDDAAVMKRNPGIFVNHHYFPSIVPRSRHIFATEIYLRLLELGRPLFNALVDAAGGKLGSLVEEMYTWWTESHAGLPPTRALVPAFVRDRFGSAHVLSSLISYVQAAGTLKPRIPHPPKGGKGRRLVLSRHVKVVHGVPDCGSILKRLHAGKTLPMLPRRLLEERHDLLIVLDEKTQRTRNFLMDPGLAALVKFFARPRSRAEFLQTFGSKIVQAEKCLTQFRELALESCL